jgi:hypothetical protein
MGRVRPCRTSESPASRRTDNSPSTVDPHTSGSWSPRCARTAARTPSQFSPCCAPFARTKPKSSKRIGVLPQRRMRSGIPVERRPSQRAQSRLHRTRQHIHCINRSIVRMGVRPIIHVPRRTQVQVRFVPLEPPQQDLGATQIFHQRRRPHRSNRGKHRSRSRRTGRIPSRRWLSCRSHFLNKSSSADFARASSAPSFAT